MERFDALLKLAYVLKSTGYTLGIDAFEDSMMIKILAWIAAFKLSQKRPGLLAWAALTFPKFRLGVGRKDADRISPAEHLFRFFVFRKLDVKFAPRVPLWFTLWTGIR